MEHQIESPLSHKTTAIILIESIDKEIEERKQEKALIDAAIWSWWIYTIAESPLVDMYYSNHRYYY